MRRPFRFDEPNALLTRIRAVTNQHSETGVIDRSYALLDVLDQKSSGLLQFNAIMIAAAALLMSDTSAILPSTPGFVMLFSLIACGLALSVLHISWPFLENVHTPGVEELDLARTIEHRRRRYTCALALSWAAVVGLIGRVVF